ncbi:ribosomal protein L11 [Cladochytrium replicatum]|nr:ribosomal protein L11 [Cladochytrium replicatum]
MSTPRFHTIRIRVPAGKASPSPPVGPALGQRGIKSMDFCKSFNDKSAIYSPGIPLQVRIKVNADKSYNYTISSPPTSWLILRAAGIEKGAAKPGSETVGTLSLKHVYELAKIKHNDPTMQHMPLRNVAAEIVGQARSIGVTIVH